MLWLKHSGDIPGRFVLLILLGRGWGIREPTGVMATRYVHMCMTTASAFSLNISVLYVLYWMPFILHEKEKVNMVIWPVEMAYCTVPKERE